MTEVPELVRDEILRALRIRVGRLAATVNEAAPGDTPADYEHLLDLCQELRTNIEILERLARGTWLLDASVLTGLVEEASESVAYWLNEAAADEDFAKAAEIANVGLTLRSLKVVEVAA